MKRIFLVNSRSAYLVHQKDLHGQQVRLVFPLFEFSTIHTKCFERIQKIPNICQSCNILQALFELRPGAAGGEQTIAIVYTIHDFRFIFLSWHTNTHTLQFLKQII